MPKDDTWVPQKEHLSIAERKEQQYSRAEHCCSGRKACGAERMEPNELQNCQEISQDRMPRAGGREDSGRNIAEQCRAAEGGKGLRSGRAGEHGADASADAAPRKRCLCRTGLGKTRKPNSVREYTGTVLL